MFSFFFFFLENSPSRYSFKVSTWKWNLRLFSLSVYRPMFFWYPWFAHSHPASNLCMTLSSITSLPPLHSLQWAEQCLGSLCPEGFVASEGWAPSDLALSFIVCPSFQQSTATMQSSWYCCLPSQQALLFRLCQTHLSHSFSLRCPRSLFPVLF